MTLVGDITVSSILSGASLLALAGVVWKGGAWTSRVDAERRAERESKAKAFADIKQTLGNGAPGTVVRTTMCEALHGENLDAINALNENFGRVTGALEAHVNLAGHPVMLERVATIQRTLDEVKVIVVQNAATLERVKKDH